MASQTAPSSRGSTRRAASPATSGIAGDVRRHDRHAAGHRLEHRQPETFVERREDEEVGGVVEGGHLLGQYVAGEDDLVL